MMLKLGVLSSLLLLSHAEVDEATSMLQSKSSVISRDKNDDEQPPKPGDEKKVLTCATDCEHFACGDSCDFYECDGKWCDKDCGCYDTLKDLEMKTGCPGDQCPSATSKKSLLEQEVTAEDLSKGMSEMSEEEIADIESDLEQLIKEEQEEMELQKEEMEQRAHKLADLSELKEKMSQRALLSAREPEEDDADQALVEVDESMEGGGEAGASWGRRRRRWRIIPKKWAAPFEKRLPNVHKAWKTLKTNPMCVAKCTWGQAQAALKLSACLTKVACAWGIMKAGYALYTKCRSCCDWITPHVQIKLKTYCPTAAKLGGYAKKFCDACGWSR